MQTSHIGTSDVIFAYNGRDGVITDDNDLIYMRARYYSPVMRRFINADIIHGTISDSTSLNRYSYVNGNPVSFVDPFGLSPERGDTLSKNQISDIEKMLKRQLLNNKSGKLNSAYVDLLSYMAKAISMNASVSEETMVNLGILGEVELYFELESSVGSGNMSIDVNKLLEQLSSEDVIDFLNNSGVFNFDVFEYSSGSLKIDDYLSLETSSSLSGDLYNLSVSMDSSIALILNCGDAGEVKATLGLKYTKNFDPNLPSQMLVPEYAINYNKVYTSEWYISKYLTDRGVDLPTDIGVEDGSESIFDGLTFDSKAVWNDLVKLAGCGATAIMFGVGFFLLNYRRPAYN